MLLWTLLTAAHAGGLYIPDAGVRAAGRGGAWVAGVDDLTAQSWNPAALSRIEAGQLRFELAGVAQSVAFDAALGGATVRNRAPPLAIPRLSFAPELEMVEGLTLAAGVWTPWAPLYRYPAAGSQRYALEEATFAQASVGPSVAFARGSFSVGLTAAWSVLYVDTRLAATNAFEGGTDPAFDVRTHVSAIDAFAPNGVLGLLFDPGPLAVAVSYSTPTRYRATGRLESDFTDNAFYTGSTDFEQVIAVPSVADEAIALPITLPGILRAGVAVRPTDALELEANVVWEDWSVLEALRVEEVELSIATTGGEPVVITDDIVLPSRLSDAWSVRLGGELDLERLALRAGTLYERGAVPETVRSVLFPDGDKVGYGLGGTWRRERVVLDLGWTQSFVLDPEISASTVYQVAIDPLTGDVGFGESVGRGRLAVANHALGFGVGWSW